MTWNFYSSTGVEEAVTLRLLSLLILVTPKQTLRERAHQAFLTPTDPFSRWYPYQLLLWVAVWLIFLAVQVYTYIFRGVSLHLYVFWEDADAISLSITHKRHGGSQLWSQHSGGKDRSSRPSFFQTSNKQETPQGSTWKLSPGIRVLCLTTLVAIHTNTGSSIIWQGCISAFQ